MKSITKKEALVMSNDWLNIIGEYVYYISEHRIKCRKVVGVRVTFMEDVEKEAERKEQFEGEEDYKPDIFVETHPNIEYLLQNFSDWINSRKVFLTKEEILNSI